MLIFIISLPPQLFQPCSGSSSLPPPGPISFSASIFPNRRRFSLSLHPLLLPHIARVWIDHTPGQRPCLPACTARLQFTPLLFKPRSSSLYPVSALPRLGAPPFLSSTFKTSSLSAPGFSRPGVPSFLCLLPPSTPPPPSPFWPQPAGQ